MAETHVVQVDLIDGQTRLYERATWETTERGTLSLWRDGRVVDTWPGELVEAVFRVGSVQEWSHPDFR